MQGHCDSCLAERTRVFVVDFPVFVVDEMDMWDYCICKKCLTELILDPEHGEMISRDIENNIGARKNAKGVYVHFNKYEKVSTCIEKTS